MTAAPSPEALKAAMEATWPPAEVALTGGLATGRGLGAGGRVSSTRAIAPDWTGADLDAAEAQHRAWGQVPMVRVYDDEARLAEVLRGRGYAEVNPTAVLANPIARLTDRPVPAMTAFTLWPPLALQRDIWTAGGIGTSRQAVMARVDGARTTLLGRTQDRAAAAAFAAVHGRVAMIHGIEVLPAFRRQGLGAALIRKAAHWAEAEGADHMALAVSRANAGAVALYAGMGFAEVIGYSYHQLSV